MCISGTAILKAGAGMNSSISGASLTVSGAGTQVAIDNWIDQAESTINTVTRFNWTDKYDTLDDDVKFILEEAVSNLAAIYAIQFDMSGYTSRTEAETMMDVLRDAALRAISILKDIKSQTFINDAGF